MATRSVKKTTPSQSTPQPKKDYVELKVPKLKKPDNIFTIILVILLLGLAFVAGTLYTKVQYLEAGVSDAPATTADGAFEQYAKQLKLNVKDFKKCYADGKYASRVNSDLNEGTNVGVRATPAFYINGILLGGAYPYESFKEIIDKILAGTATENPADYSELLQNAYADEANRSFDPVPKTIAIGDAPIKGDKNAQVTIVEFSDFQCPFCKQATPTVDQILNDYKGKVKLAYKHYPINSIHPNAQKAAEASECAREQGKFYEYHDLLFQNQQLWANLPQQSQTSN